MHKHDGVILGKHNVRLARQFGMQPEPQSGAVKEAAYGALRFRVLSANPGHHPASRGAIHNIHQRTKFVVA